MRYIQLNEVQVRRLLKEKNIMRIFFSGGKKGRKFKIDELVYVKEPGWFKKFTVSPFNTIRVYKADKWDKSAEPWGDMEPKRWMDAREMPSWATRIIMKVKDVDIDGSYVFELWRVYGCERGVTGVLR